MDIIAIALLSPARADSGFCIMFPLTFGSIFVWAGWITINLSRPAGLRAAIIFLTVVTLIILTGAVLQSALGVGPDKAMNPLLAAARLSTGLWIPAAWAAVIRAARAA